MSKKSVKHTNQRFTSLVYGQRLDLDATEVARLAEMASGFAPHNDLAISAFIKLAFERVSAEDIAAEIADD